MFAPFDLPRGVLLLVTDQLASPADFVLHRAVVEHLKPSVGARVQARSTEAREEKENPKVIVLSVSEDPARWGAIAAKSNLPLAAPSFLLVDVLALGLRGALDALVRALSPTVLPSEAKGDTDADTQADTDVHTDTLVLLDDLAALEWLGVAPVLELTRWCRALGAVCRRTNATLLIRQHVLTAGEDSEGNMLLRALREQCAFHMEVLPLASGRSGAVSGQVALHAGPGTARNGSGGGVRLLARSVALQYKLTDGPGGAVFFERGTGAGVL